MFSHVVHAPYVNLLKLVEESDVLVRGEAKLTIDRAIGKKVYSVRGKVASESFVQIPADRAHSLGLRGRYVYVQLKPSADKHFTLNLTFTTAGHGSLTLSLSNGFKARKLLGTVLQVPYPEPSARWATLAVDVPRLLKEIFPTAAGDGSGEYVCLRSVHGLPSFSLRSVFSSETLYEPASLPRDVIFPLPRGSAWEQLYAWHALPAVDDAPFIAEFASPPQAKLATGRMGTAPAGALRTPTSGGAVSESPRQPQQAAVPTWSTPTSRPAPSPRPRLESTRVLSGHEPGGREPGRESHGGSLSADRRASLANTSWAAGSPSYAGGAGGDHFATPPSAMGRWAAEGEEAEGASEALTGSRAEGSSLLALGRAIGLNSSAPQTAVWLPERNVVCYAAASLLVLHEIETGAQRHLIGHTARVCALSICGGTQTLLASAQEGRSPTVRLWLVASGCCVGVLCAHAADLCTLALSADGALLAACGSDTGARQVIALWDTSAVRAGGAAKLIASKRTEQHVAALKFCAGPQDDELGSDEERNRLVSCGAENVCFWRLKGGTLRHCVAELQGHNHEAFVAIAVDVGVGRNALSTVSNRRAFVATASGKLMQLRVETRALEFVFQLHTTMIAAVHLTEAFCITGSVDGVLRVWPLDFSEFLLEAEHEGPVSCIESSSDGLTILIAIDRVNALGLMDLSTHRYITLVRSHQGPVLCAAADPRRRQFVTASADGSVRVWDSDSGRQICEFEAAGELPSVVVYHPTEHALAVGYEGGAVRVFDVESTSMSHEYKLHTAKVVALHFDSHGRCLFSASTDGALVAYDALKDYWPMQVYAAPKPGGSVSMALLPGESALVAAMSVVPTRSSVGGGGAVGGVTGGGSVADAPDSPTDILAVCGLERGLLLLFHAGDLRRPPAQIELTVSGGRAAALTLSHDGGRAFVCGANGSLLRYELATGEMTGHAPNLHREPIETIALSASGTHIVTAGADRIIKVWPLQTLFGSVGASKTGARRKLGVGGLPPHQSFVAHGDGVCAVGFSSALGATQLVSVGRDGLVAVWEVSEAVTQPEAEEHAAGRGRTTSSGLLSTQRMLHLADFRTTVASTYRIAPSTVAGGRLRAGGGSLASGARSSFGGGGGGASPGGLRVADGGALTEEEYGFGSAVVYGGARRSTQAPADRHPTVGEGYGAPDEVTRALLSHAPSASPAIVLPVGGGVAIGLTAEAGAWSLAWRAEAGVLVFASGAACVLDDIGGAGPKRMALLPGAVSLAVSLDEGGTRAAFCDSAAPSEAFVWHAGPSPLPSPASPSSAAEAQAGEGGLVRLEGFRGRALALALCADGELLVVLSDGEGAPVLSVWHTQDGTLLAARALAEESIGVDAADAQGEEGGEDDEDTELAEQRAVLHTRPLRALSSLVELPSAASPLAFAVAGAAGVQAWQLATTGGMCAGRGKTQSRRGRLVCLSTWDVPELELALASPEPPSALASLGRSLALVGEAGGALALYHCRAGWTRRTESLTEKSDGEGGQRASAVHVASCAVGEVEVSWLLAVAFPEVGPEAVGGAVGLWRLALAHPTQDAPAEGALRCTPLLKVGLPAPALSLGGDDAATLAATADGSVWHIGWSQAVEKASALTCLQSSPAWPLRDIALSASGELLVTCSAQTGAAVWWLGGRRADEAEAVGPQQLALLRTADELECTCIALPAWTQPFGELGEDGTPAVELCALGFASGRVRLFDLSAVELLCELRPHARGGMAPGAGAAPVERVAFVPHRQVLLSANAEGEVVMCDYAKSGTPTRLLRAASGCVPRALEVGLSGAWLLLSSPAQLCVWAGVPADCTASGAMPGTVLDMTLVAAQLGGTHPGGGAVAAFVSRPTSRAPDTQAIVCAGVDAEASRESPYAMAYDAGSRHVLWSTLLDAPPLAICAAAGSLSHCAIALFNGTIVLVNAANGSIGQRLLTVGRSALVMRFGHDRSLYLADERVVLKMNNIDAGGGQAVE